MVERTLGKGEVESSILSGGTSFIPYFNNSFASGCTIFYPTRNIIQIYEAICLRFSFFFFLLIGIIFGIPLKIEAEVFRYQVHIINKTPYYVISSSRRKHWQVIVPKKSILSKKTNRTIVFNFNSKQEIALPQNDRFKRKGFLSRKPRFKKCRKTQSPHSQRITPLTSVPMLLTSPEEIAAIALVRRLKERCNNPVGELERLIKDHFGPHQPALDGTNHLEMLPTELISLVLANPALHNTDLQSLQAVNKPLRSIIRSELLNHSRNTTWDKREHTENLLSKRKIQRFTKHDPEVTKLDISGWNIKLPTAFNALQKKLPNLSTLIIRNSGLTRHSATGLREMHIHKLIYSPPQDAPFPCVPEILAPIKCTLPKSLVRLEIEQIDTHYIQDSIARLFQWNKPTCIRIYVKHNRQRGTFDLQATLQENDQINAELIIDHLDPSLTTRIIEELKGGIMPKNRTYSIHIENMYQSAEDKTPYDSNQYCDDGITIKIANTINHS